MQWLLSPRLVGLVVALELLQMSPMNGRAASSEQSKLVFIGTYTGGKSRGIYVSRFNSATGELTPPELAAETKNPTFLAVHPKRPCLYAANEVGDFDGRKVGSGRA